MTKDEFLSAVKRVATVDPKRNHEYVEGVRQFDPQLAALFDAEEAVFQRAVEHCKACLEK